MLRPRMPHIAIDPASRSNARAASSSRTMHVQRFLARIQIPPALRRRLEPLPFPVRFSDDRVRLSTVRLALLRRLWMKLGARESQQALNAYHGGDVLDIGAFHGWYSVLLAPAADAGDRFLSFEPDFAAVPDLRATLDDLRKQFPGIELSVVTEAVGDGASVAVSRPSGTGEGTHPRFASGSDGATQPSLVVDDVVATKGLRPRLVKIDVEGAEMLVLRGMRDTLASHRPAVMLEIHPEWQPDGIDAADVEALIRDAGYQGQTLEELPMIRRQIWLPVAAPPTPAA